MLHNFTQPTDRPVIRPRIWALAVAISAIGLSGCAARNIGPQLVNGPAETEKFPDSVGPQLVPDYRIGTFDTLAINVFQEPDLSVKDIRVDANGRISLALVGEVVAAGQTPLELSRELERLYGARYLVRPQIAVNVTNAVSQKVVVQGQVRTPGVYPIQGQTSLLEAISLAQGETDVAALKEVIILRTINGQKMGARFDVGAIRRAESPDPAVYGSDTVIVGYSNVRGIWQDVLKAAPLLNVFRPVDW